MRRKKLALVSLNTEACFSCWIDSMVTLAPPPLGLLARFGIQSQGPTGMACWKLAQLRPTSPPFLTTKRQHLVEYAGQTQTEPLCRFKRQPSSPPPPCSPKKTESSLGRGCNRRVETTSPPPCAALLHQKTHAHVCQGTSQSPEETCSDDKSTRMSPCWQPAIRLRYIFVSWLVRVF